MTGHRSRVYLASRSPRRRMLLEQVGVPFDVVPVGVDEAAVTAPATSHHVIRLAQAKARAGAAWVADRNLPANPVLGADTLVAIDGVVLGKPRDLNHAAAMLARLSGRAHSVLTGVAVYHDGRVETALSESRVHFARLSDQDIAHYCASGEPMDKAGAYAVQGLAGAFVIRLEGSYSGVVGLPLWETCSLLNQIAGAKSWIGSSATGLGGPWDPNGARP